LQLVLNELKHLLFVVFEIARFIITSDGDIVDVQNLIFLSEYLMKEVDDPTLVAYSEQPINMAISYLGRRFIAGARFEPTTLLSSLWTIRRSSSSASSLPRSKL